MPFISTIIAAAILHAVLGSGVSASSPDDGFVAGSSAKGVFSDKRIKTNVKNVDTSEMLSVISELQLKEFDYESEQFYNAIFGKRQYGFIAQEVQTACPRAVGKVKRRQVNLPDGTNTVIKDLLAVNQETLFVANIGATQELLKVSLDLAEKVDSAVKASEAQVGSSAATIEQMQKDLVKMSMQVKEAKESGETALSETKETRKSLTPRVDRTETKATDLEADLKALKKEQEGATRKMNDALSEALMTMEASAKRHKSELDNYRKDADDQKKVISQLQTQGEAISTDLKGVASKLSDLGNKVASHAEKHAHLSAKIPAMEDGIAAAKESAALIEDRVSREMAGNLEKAMSHADRGAEKVLKDVKSDLDTMDAKFSERHNHGRNAMAALKKNTEETIREVRDAQSAQRVELEKGMESMQKLVEGHRRDLLDEFGGVKESLHARMHNLSTTTTTHIADLRSTASSHHDRLLQASDDLTSHRESVGKELGALSLRCDRLEKSQEDDARALESVRSTAASLKQTLEEQRQASLHRTDELEKKMDGVSREAGIASSGVAALKESLASTNADLGELKTKSEVTFEGLGRDVRDVASEVEKTAKSLGDALDAAVASRREEVANDIAVSKKDIEEDVGAMVADLSMRIKSGDESVRALLEERIAHLGNATGETLASHALLLEKLSARNATHGEHLAALDAEIQKLWAEVHKQAAAELIERRKLAEAEARAAEARVEEQRVKGEQDRLTAEKVAKMKREDREEADRAMRERVDHEASTKQANELELIARREESAKRLESEKAAQQQQLVEMQRDADVKKIEAERETKLRLAEIEHAASAQTERDNKDVREDLARVQGEQSKHRAVAVVQQVAAETAAAVAKLDRSHLAMGIGAAIALAAGVYFARESITFVRYQIEKSLGKPSLLRETSRRRGLSLRSRSAALPNFLQGVVLHPNTDQQLRRIALSAKTAHTRKAPLRHVMFFGKPGTGKTMVAKRLAQWCGMDYAIMSGADVAPLKEQAVTELHSLFKWARSCPRGVLLFIDEADAFLASRDNKVAGMSEEMRNALTALLYHTGNPTSNLMMVLATNRPKDLDTAVLNRIDESVHFALPSLRERYLLCWRYFEEHILLHAEAKSGRCQDLRDYAALGADELALTLNNQSQGQSAIAEARRRRSSVEISALRRAQTRIMQFLRDAGLAAKGPDAIVMDVTVKPASIKSVATKVSGFSGREIAKLFSSVQAHVYGSLGGEDGKPMLCQDDIDHVVSSIVAQHENLDNFEQSTSLGARIAVAALDGKSRKKAKCLARSNAQTPDRRRSGYTPL